MKDDDARRLFMRARWPSTECVPVCPKCGVTGATPIRRRRFRRSAIQCRREFSVTSGTIFSNRKLPFRTLIMAIAISVHSVKAKAARQLKRGLGRVSDACGRTKLRICSFRGNGRFPSRESGMARISIGTRLPPTQADSPRNWRDAGGSRQSAAAPDDPRMC